MGLQAPDLLRQSQHATLVALCLLLLLAGWTSQAQNTTVEWSLSDLPFLDRFTSFKSPVIVPLKPPPPGYEPAKSDEEWAPFLKANLDDDLEPFRKRNAHHGKRLTLPQLARQLRRAFTHQSRVALVMFKGNTSYILRTRMMGGYALKRVKRFAARVSQYAQDMRLAVPDTIFALNTFDEPMCRIFKGGCVAPMMSFFKRYDFDGNKSVDQDLLLPHLGHSFNQLSFYPWHLKDKRAMIRASMQGTMKTNATRVQLARLTASPEGKPYLDCGIVANHKAGWAMPQEYKQGYVAMDQHAKWKFLVNADGHTAACRMGHIMQMNSVVLKERSHWIEYYYRSLVNGTHHLWFDHTTILPMLKQLDDPQHDAYLRQLADNSQHFCAKYLTPESKVVYTLHLLREYTALFDGLSEWMRRFPVGKGRLDFRHIYRSLLKSKSD